MAEEIKFLREQINEKKFVIRSLFSLKLSNREEDNVFHKVRKNTNGKNTSDSCTDDEIPEWKRVNGTIKDDIALHKNNDYNQSTDEDSNNLLTTSIKIVKHLKIMLLEPLKHRIIRLHQHGKRNFKSTRNYSSAVQLKPNLIKEKINTRKETQTAQTENINNADNDTVQQNNEEWRKGITLILGDPTISGPIEKKMSRNRKIKVRYFQGAKIKDVCHYSIPLLQLLS